ncbi:MAG: hypothetical protein HY532_04975 [Chloroflexi bacterium]|nr:hypothetical protein [Chloroflexota bacterium]
MQKPSELQKLTGRWGDSAWGQTSYKWELWRWTGSYYVLVADGWYDDSVGSHAMQDGFPTVGEGIHNQRIFQKELDLVALGQLNNSYYQFCARSHNYHYGGGGVRGCSYDVLMSW